jgi:hypothetical protein
MSQNPAKGDCMDKSKLSPVHIQPLMYRAKLQFKFNGATRQVGNYENAHQFVEMMLELDDRIKAIESQINVLDDRTK